MPPPPSFLRSSVLLLLPCLFLGVVAFLPSPVAPQAGGRTSSGPSRPLYAAADKSSSSSSTNPFATFGQQVNSFFEKLMGGAGGGGKKPSSQKSSAPSTKPKRRTGGPVSVVFGATGRAGREIVNELLKQGHDVVAAVRNESKLADIFGSEVLATSPTRTGHGLLDWVAGVDVTDATTLGQGTPMAAVLNEADHVVVALGPVGGPQPGGGFGFLPGLTSEDVDFKGTIKVIDAFADARKTNNNNKAKSQTLFSFQKPEDLARWQRLDDVIMGGRSSSALELNAAEGYAEYKGNLVVEDGGFCGTRASGIAADLSGFDGVRLTVMGDGNRYKLNVKTTDTLASENVYQAAFDTVKGAWMTIDLPFDRFFPVVRNRLDYKAPPLKASSQVAVSFGFVYSRFEFNRAPNPHYAPGPFSLKLKDVSVYSVPRPALLLVSSAGAERNAKVETEEDRTKEIPIVMLNPGGILNWKYKAETYLRTMSPSLPYTIIRACGLVPDKAFDQPARLEAGQGDSITGTLTRQDLAEAVAAALSSPFTTGKTLELRRDEANDALNKRTNFDLLFQPLVRDSDRAVAGIAGLFPFPAPTDPPAAVSPERAKEILNDPRVKAQQDRDRAIAAEKASKKEEEAVPVARVS